MRWPGYPRGDSGVSISLSHHGVTLLLSVLGFCVYLSVSPSKNSWVSISLSHHGVTLLLSVLGFCVYLSVPPSKENNKHARKLEYGGSSLHLHCSKQNPVLCCLCLIIVRHPEPFVDGASATRELEERRKVQRNTRWACNCVKLWNITHSIYQCFVISIEQKNTRYLWSCTKMFACWKKKQAGSLGWIKILGYHLYFR